MAGADSSHSSPVPIVHKNREPELYQFSAARIAVTYLIAGLLWIFLSDLSLAWSGEVTVTGLLISMGKGASFVLVSSFVVFWLSKREYRKTMNATALLGAVVEGTTDAVFVKDLQGRYLLINKAGAKFIGRSVSDVLKRDDRDLFEFNEVQRLMARDKEIMAGGQVVTHEESLTSNGVTRTYQTTKAPFFDSRGNIAGLIGVSRDVTDRTRIEAELRETDARLREAQRIARLGSWYWEQATDRVWWSDAEFELFGVEKRKVRPSLESFLESVHPDDRSTILGRVEALQQGANEIACDVRVIRPNGTCIWVHSRARASRDSSGKLVRVEGIDQDITEQRLAESKLREQEMLALEAAELAHVGGWGFDPNTKQSDWTRQVFHIFGVSASSPPPVSEVLDLFFPEHRPIIEAAFEEAVQDGTQYDLEVQLTTATGEKKWVRSICHPIVEGNKVVRVRGSIQDITDRKRVEAELRIREERYRQLFESNPHPMWVYDIDTFQFLAVNDAAVQTYGYTREEFLEMNLSDIQSAEAIARLKSYIAQVASGLNRSGIWRHRRKNGEIFDVDVHSHGLPHGYGRSRLVLALDITDRKKAEAELQASERRLRLALESAGAIAFTWEIPSDAVTRYFSKEPSLPATSERVGNISEVRSRIHPDDLPHFDSCLQNCLAEGTEYRNAYRVVRSDGTIVHLEEYGYLDRASDGSPLQLTGMSVDVTNRVAATESLRVSEAQLRSVLDSVGDPILSIDSRGRIVAFNESTEVLFGYTEGELLHTHVRVLVPELPTPDIDRFLSGGLQAGTSQTIGASREVDGRKKDGSKFPAELTITEFSRDDERHFTWVLRDITYRRQLEEQFRQSQKMEAVGRLAGGVAHDFNNLLTVINGYSDLLLKQKHETDPAIEMLSEIRDAGERAARLTHQLLAFSRKSLVQPKLVDLNELVAESTKLLRRLIGEDITLEVVMEKSPLRVMIDPGQFEQVLMNLVVNSRDAMPSGGRLTIETSYEEIANVTEKSVKQYVSLRVTDTGIGIEEEVRDKIFEPFFTTKGVGQGTGLGLSVVHGVVQQAGGSVSIESSIGSGATFKILLPAIKQTDIPNASRDNADVPRGDETILLVEDEDAVRTLVRVALKKQGFKVLSASCSKDALNLLDIESNDVHLLVTDVIMPGQSGRELADEIRKTYPTLRVLYMSGYTDDALDRHGMKGSSDQFIQKPFTPLGLIRKVRELLDER